MRKYLTYRILLIIPTLFIISWVGFYLSKHVPQDPVNSILSMRGMQEAVYSDYLNEYKRVYRELGMDRPSFYFSIVPHHYPANLNQIEDPRHREWVQSMLEKNIPFKSIESYLSKTTNEEWLSGGTDALSIPKELQEEAAAFYYPVFRWHGTDNQYHNWIMSFFAGSFGISIADGKPALQKCLRALSWTLAITLVDLVISLILGIMIGVWLARDPEGKAQQRVAHLLYGLYSMPLFWLATLFIVFFTTSDYGNLTNIFPSVGIDVYPGESNFSQIMKNFHKLILPILCLTLHSLAYISRFVRRSILNEMDKSYIITAYSKGLTRNQVINRHALPNALIPIITLLGAVIPGAFTGSLVLEVLFNIPGFGRLLYSSISIADWNVVFCILLIIAFVTIISYLLTDVLYAVFNPKIRYSE